MKKEKLILGIITLLAWFALITQFCILIKSGTASKTELIIQYFSYFTIECNIIIALCSSFLLLNPSSYWGVFFSKQTTLAAITVYITIVCITYNTILRFIWSPQGWHRVADELLHLIVPLLFLIYWLLFVQKNKLQWRHAFTWMIYPAIYGAFVLTRGYFSSSRFYPYPFIDMNKLGINKGIINTIAFVCIFLAASFLFVAIGKFMSKKTSRN